jgi:outer membrane protein assembly factor BamB
MSLQAQQNFPAFVLAVLATAWIMVAGPAERVAADEPDYPPQVVAANLGELSGIAGGFCCVLGGDNLELALELAGSGKFYVSLLDPQGSAVEQARESADKRGLYGKSVIALQGSCARLPFADNTVDLIVTAKLRRDQLEKLTPDELLRVLRPRGKAVIGSLKGGTGVNSAQLSAWLRDAGECQCVGTEDALGAWAVFTAPSLKGADDWSHWEHGPDNNPVSNDTAIKAPYMTQFLGLPYYITMPAVTTVAGGRIFTAMGHIAHHKREEPWLNTLIARNGYNGLELWRHKFPDGYLVHRSAFIATEKAFYMIDPQGDGCLLLDTETGLEKDRIRVPGLEGEWKWIAISDGILYALAGSIKDPPQTTIVRSPARAWSWDDLSTGYYEERIPWGFGTTIGAYDLAGGKVLWTHQEKAQVDSRAMVIGEGKLFFYGPDSHLGCLEAKTGELLWTNGDPEIRELIEEPGRGLTSTPGWRTTCFCLYTPKALFYEAQTRMNIVAVSNKDGSLLWHRTKTTNNPNMLYVDDNLVVGIGPGGSTQVIDPATGVTLEDLGFRKRSCARLTACWDSYFCRGWPEGLTRYDRINKKILFNGAVRPSCNDGVIPANGLLYMGPWACDCNLSLMGRVVLCSAGDFEFERKAVEKERLELLQDNPRRVASFDVSDLDWATYRGNNARSACSKAVVPDEAEMIWEYRMSGAAKPCPPTAAGDLVFVCGDDCKVRAIEAATGKLKWTFLAGGAVIQPPTIWQGRAYLGAGDGYIYALEAATGKPLWRFRAAPVERRIMAYGSLCSTWPVNSGVLVQDGIAYAAAGIIDCDGTYVYALDAVTGRIRWQNNTSGHLDKELRKGVSAQGVLTVGQGRLWMPGGNVVSPASYDLANGKYLGGSAGDGSPKANRGEDIGLLNGRYLLHGGRLRFSAAENVVNPGRFTVLPVSGGNQAKELNLCDGRIQPAWDDSKLLMVNGKYSKLACYALDELEGYLGGEQGDKRPEGEWSAEGVTGWRLQESDAVSIAIAKNVVLVVYETPVIRNRNSRWTLRSLNPADGATVWEQRLPSPVLPGGLLVDREGRVIVVMEDGSVVCYAGKGA